MPPIPLAQALAVLQQELAVITASRSEEVPLAEAVGRVSAEEVVATIDHPPGDQSLRDGVAYAPAATADSWPATTNSLVHRSIEFERDRQLVGEVFPGEHFARPLVAGEAVRIMTGAVIPTGAVGVAMLEEVEWINDRDSDSSASHGRPHWELARHATRVRLPTRCSSTHVLTRGSVFRRGERLIPIGTQLQPIHIGLLASTGRDSLCCFVKPRVAILTTGDELTNAGHALQRDQIYNSNGPLLHSLLRLFGVTEIAVAHAGDSESQIVAWLHTQLGKVDLVLTTGAVSAGEKDQLPTLFQRLGVRTLFHGVHLKPGKPIYCGRFRGHDHDRDANAAPSLNTMVMGFPGNPISVWVTFHLFAWPLIAALSGSPARPNWFMARLTQAGDYQDSRLTFWPGRLEFLSAPWEESNNVESLSHPSLAESLRVTPLDWQGSPDLRTPTAANCLIYFPPNAPAPTINSPVHVMQLPMILG
ncbi:MAG: molybdopterin molybdotransferase MoeA [Planctomycetaceae bacterium]|nr:molybdopterin molybdotransferase MoeA [Planctomycetaceae bacterium]